MMERKRKPSFNVIKMNHRNRHQMIEKDDHSFSSSSSSSSFRYTFSSNQNNTQRCHYEPSLPDYGRSTPFSITHLSLLFTIILSLIIDSCLCTFAPETSAASTTSYGFHRPTPFAPDYRPECDIIFPASARATPSSDVHQTTSSIPYSISNSFSKRSSYIPGGHVCITYEDINRAVSEAKMMLGVFSVPYEVKELSSENPKPPHIAKVGDILIQASKILARMHGLSREAILYGLPRIDTTKTSVKDICPTFLKPVKCEISKYRTLSGMCNNLDYPSWGSSRSAMLRFLPPDYSDGLTAPRQSKSGEPLPPPRIISFMLHQDISDYDNEVTYLVIAWGQMLDHDLTFAALPKDKNDKSIQCCKYPASQRHPSCYPISIPADDPFFKFFNRQCMDFVRSMPGVKPNCLLGPRHQINQVSSFIDANFVYGNAQSTTKRLREFVGGRLKTQVGYRNMGFKDLLPMKTQNPDSGCERSGRGRNMYCFDTGDVRSNEQLQLAVMHTVWMRQHNAIADKLSTINTHWSDETLFQEARRIVGAMVQHITYNEFLPIIIGNKAMNKYGINLLKNGYYSGYDPKTNPGIRVEFQASAFRFGHSILPDATERFNKFHEKLESIRLSTMLRQPYRLYQPGVVDSFIFGLVNQPAYRVDSEITSEVTNHLFEKPGENFGLDLAAINVVRSREMGIPGYNEVREYCGMKRIRHFEELFGLIDNATIHRYLGLYRHVDDIDLWSAGIAEFPLMGAMVGPTFSCIIGEQFAHIRNGDRFWYENEGWPSQFTENQLTELRKVKLARLLCENADDMDTVQLYPMLAAHHSTNPRVSCHDLPKLDLSHWRELPYFDTGFDEYKSKAKAAKAA
ncbi:hypothetical protein RDWZM_002026 [Blomia tropicalis]|uniref:Uncharacterized protein n=1 Tax=Blomia tropicalis TaxID=40697 RepID=A0A9Q0RRU9_BLOTA|nr:hypothetical protein RDWZM_002026 [Blomia tropicalis]